MGGKGLSTFNFILVFGFVVLSAEACPRGEVVLGGGRVELTLQAYHVPAQLGQGRGVGRVRGGELGVQPPEQVVDRLRTSGIDEVYQQLEDEDQQQH